MKKLQYIYSLLFLLPGITFGAGIPQYPDVTGLDKPTTLIAKIAQGFGTLVFGLSVLILLYAGFQYLTAGGDPKKTEGAKNTIIYAIIGLIVAALAYVLPTWIGAALTSGTV